jgi:feruloyl esterase
VCSQRFWALQRWVEEGVAPDMLIATTDQPLATHASENTTQPAAFTRPLCPYPEEAQYKGVGDPTDAANFACRRTDRDHH